MYRRNFTFRLASLSNSQDGAAWSAGNNPALSWNLEKSGVFPPGTDGHDLSSIACAVDFFGQDDIYRTYFNALCYNGESINKGRGKSRGTPTMIEARVIKSDSFYSPG